MGRECAIKQRNLPNVQFAREHGIWTGSDKKLKQRIGRRGWNNFNVSDFNARFFFFADLSRAYNMVRVIEVKII